MFLKSFIYTKKKCIIFAKRERMNRKLLFLCLNLMMGFMIFAQSVGISDTVFTPDSSAMLEIRATDKGLLIPRVALTQTTSPSPITNPAVSLLVYNTASVNDVTPGYYYWDGSRWIKLTTNAEALPSWYLSGNAADTSDFIGTTNAEAFRIYTNNTERMRITATGNVGIGTTSPAAQLHTTGTVRFSNYASGAYGALLRTDANGDLQLTNFSGNATDVLRGDGTFGPVPGMQITWGANTYISNPSVTWYTLRDVTVTTHETSAVLLHGAVRYYQADRYSDFVYLQILRDGTAICEISEFVGFWAPNTTNIHWIDEPTPGPHTYTLRIGFLRGGESIASHQLHVIEIKR